MRQSYAPRRLERAALNTFWGAQSQSHQGDLEHMVLNNNGEEHGVWRPPTLIDAQNSPFNTQLDVRGSALS